MTRPFLTHISPMSIRNELDKYVAGQDEAKKVLSILAYNHQMRLYHCLNKRFDMPSTEIEPPRLVGLITGATGTGKTLLVETLAKILDYPYIKIDATQLSRPGYSGEDIYDWLNTLCTSVAGHIKEDYIDRAIIFIDEIDKLGHKSASNQSDDHNRDLQHTILSVVDGTKVSHTRKVLDTSKMLFIFGGAFENIYKERDNKRQGMGFKGETTTSSGVYTKDLKREEIEGAGIIRELLGRMHVITHTNKLSKEEIKKVLMEVQDNLLGQFEAIFHLSENDTPVGYEKAIDGIVDKLYDDNNYGMRLVKTMLFDYFKEHLYHLDCDMKTQVDIAKEMVKEEDLKK